MPLRCQVCGDEKPDTSHFGAVACRACAAFFRRSVAQHRVYGCKNRSPTPCLVPSHIRKTCRACRFTRCLAAGMKPSEVKSGDGQPLNSDLQVNLKVVVASSEAFPDVPSISNSTATPILNRMNENYVRLEAIRKLIHRRDGESLFAGRARRALSYKETNDLYLKESELMADWISNCFPEFAALPRDQKKALYKNFLLPFVLLECSYLCCINGDVDVVSLPSGDYIDLLRPETFYVSTDGKEAINAEQAAKLFNPFFAFVRKSLITPFEVGRLERFELFFLCAIALWDQGVELTSDETRDVCRRCREDVVREMHVYYSRVRKLDDASLRIANLLVLLPALQRSVYRYEEDMQVGMAFKLYSVEQDFSSPDVEF